MLNTQSLFSGEQRPLFATRRLERVECSKPLFQREAKCDAIDMKMIFHSYANKTHLHKKGFALSLVLKVRVLQLGNGILSLCGIQFEKRLKKSCNEERRAYVSQGLEDFPLELK